jgi:A/G-specific adenine glycosylase
VPGPAPLPADLCNAILAWYAVAGRDLPFRRTTDPYAILVSEAMAQQTQAARAGEAWTRFMTAFPTVAALARATPADVLRAWQGLGYNRRALNLWRAAGRIVNEFGGRVPSSVEALETLPGVGPYTARAVAAIAFGERVGAVDTNVRRVLGRITAGDAASLTPEEMQRFADDAVPFDRAGRWTHALMDIGAMRCHPRRPACETCPARPWCRHAASDADDTPARTGVGRAAREAAPPFRTTSRWLRGRIVDRLRDAPDRAWVVIGGSIGDHDGAAVETAVLALAADGLVEVEPSGPDLLVRLAVT